MSSPQNECATGLGSVYESPTQQSPVRAATSARSCVFLPPVTQSAWRARHSSAPADYSALGSSGCISQHYAGQSRGESSSSFLSGAVISKALLNSWLSFWKSFPNYKVEWVKSVEVEIPGKSITAMNFSELSFSFVLRAFNVTDIAGLFKEKQIYSVEQHPRQAIHSSSIKGLKDTREKDPLDLPISRWTSSWQNKNIKAEYE